MLDSNFLQNKYSRTYVSLMERAKFRLPPSPCERHHIIPTSVGGANTPENIVALSPREHFIAHALLIKCTTGLIKKKMCYALSFFRTSNKNHKRELTSWQYEAARRAQLEAKRGWMPSAKIKAAVSAAKRGVSLSDEQKRRIGVALRKQIPCWYLINDEYGVDDDFYRFCDKIKVGRGGIQRGINARGFHVVTNGNHKGTVISFTALSKEQMIDAREASVFKSKNNRSAAVTANHARRRQQTKQKVDQPRPPIMLKIHENIDVRLMSDYTPDTSVRTFWFFEDELSRPEIIQSMLDHAAKLSKKLHARKTTIEVLDKKIAREFLRQNHLQGAGSGALLYLGLRMGDQLVSVMSFGKARYNPVAKYELLRFASILGTVVVGGASKLMRHAEQRLDGQIVSYADLRYGTGNVYGELGFKHTGNSSPGYWYLKDGRRHHRSQFQKHKLHRLLSNFDASQTEIQNMKQHGYLRVFDLGHAVYLSEPKTSIV